MGNNLSGTDDPVTSKSTERGQSYPQNIRYAASGMKGLRATMEDMHLYTSEILIDGVVEPLSDHSLFAVFDGHGGDFTSAYAAEHFLPILGRQAAMKEYANLAKTGSDGRDDVPGVELLRKALDAVFGELDAQLREVQQQKNDAIDNMPPQDLNGESIFCGNGQMYEHSGSTCVVVLLTPSHVIGCNAGDSRAVLRRAGHTLPLSFDHKPSEVSEKDRITEAGGFVKARRVDGDLAVSRAFGDFVYKTNDNMPTNKQKVIANPDFVVYPRSSEEDEFIILACDGIWDVASSKQCADFVQQLLQEGESDLGVICEEALDTCLERNSKDNMTILVVGLPGMRSANSAVKLQNAVWGRRALRQAKVFNMQASQIAAQFGIVSASDGKSDVSVYSDSSGSSAGSSVSSFGAPPTAKAAPKVDPSNGFASHLQNTVAPPMIAT